MYMRVTFQGSTCKDKIIQRQETTHPTWNCLPLQTIPTHLDIGALSRQDLGSLAGPSWTLTQPSESPISKAEGLKTLSMAGKLGAERALFSRLWKVT